ncbi:MAG: DUF1640 domain-containing protein [Alphaproteobacteria bacterium]|nr:DUF1640 domain-containing protein [Alphaproteobacteria bacterium]MBV9862766.1 DUF1640 domain-containing protein [Alphaproteobacteria bacterium]
MAAMLDTLQIVKRLREAGIEERQAEAFTGVFRDWQETQLSSLATKADIERLELKIANEVGRLEAKLTNDIGALETKLTNEIGALETKLTNDIGALETKLTNEIGRLDERMNSLEAKIEGQLRLMRSQFDASVAAVKTDIIRWVFGIAFAQAALILTLLRLFPAPH